MMLITGKKFSKPAMSRVINGDTELTAPPEKPQKIRLDHYLVEKHPVYNRSTLQKFIKSGYVQVDKAIIKKPNALISPEQKVILTVPEPEKTIKKPPILYEDDHVIVFDKPAGLLSMAKGAYCPEPTLADFGLLVHRLDRDTSGVIILAKDEPTKRFLQQQFQNRQAQKTYYAIVVGRPKLDEALIDLPLARNLKRPTTFRVDPSGKSAQTYYKVKQANDKFSLLELKPTTGRTHQLRVHLSHLGTPILGDKVYGTKTTNQPLRLHANSLTLTLPDGQLHTFTAPLPQDFQNVF